MDRRDFILSSLSAAALLPVAAAGVRAGGPAAVVKPRRLAPGSTVGLVNPAGATFVAADVEIVEETLRALGLVPVRGAHVLDRYGYLAGRDEDRAADLNAMFARTEIDGVFAIRGGWGCARILPLLDYDTIARNPKVLMGYSDITALLLAVYARSGLVTFHGPDGISTWNAFSTGYFRRVVMEAGTPTMENPKAKGDNLAQTRDRTAAIRGGRARGRLAGGNLSVLAGLCGSPYLPSWEGTILFLEDVDEDIYRVDRMLTTLRLAGVFGGVRGVVFGKCTRCGPGEGYGSLTFGEVLGDHLAPLGVPCYEGAMIGHVADKFTVPLGVEAEIDADAGTIRLLEAAVR